MGLFGLPDIKISIPDPIKAVTQVVNDVTRGIDSTVKDIGRSDIGKGIEAVTAPARGTLRAVESVARGDLEGAAGNLAHAGFAANPINMAGAASSSIRDLYRNDTVNALTLGYTKDAAEIIDRGKENSYGKRVDATDWSLMGRQSIRGAAIAGAIYAAPMVGGKIAAMTLGEGLSAGAAVVSAAKDPRGAAEALINTYAPGVGDAIGDIYNITNPETPTTNRNPASVGTQASAAPQVVQVGSGVNTTSLLLIGGAGILGIAALIFLKQR